MGIPDNYDIWEAHEIEMEKRLARLPICENPKCKKRIQDDEYFEIDGEILCRDCMEDRYMKYTEDYCGDPYE